MCAEVVNVRTWMHACQDTCMCVYMHACTHAYTYMHTSTCMRARTTHTSMHKHACQRTAPTDTRQHIQAYTNMRANVRRQQTHNNTRATRHAQQYMHAYTYAARPDTYYSASVCEQIKVSISHHPRHSRFRPDRTHHAQRHITKGVPTTHRHILQCLA